MSVDDIIRTLPDDLKQIVEEGYFVSRVWITTTEEEYFVVDFQKQMIYEDEKFREYSIDLFNSFLAQERWYEC